jgi:Domain of unknown function (DUF4352)
MGHRGDYRQRQDPRLRPAVIPPQWGHQAPPRQDGGRAGQQRDSYRQGPQPGFTPSQGQPQPTWQQPYAPQPAWQQPAWQQPAWQQPYSPQPAWQQPYAPQYAPARAPQRKRHTARNVIAGIGGLIAVIIVISVAANNGHTVQTASSAADTTAHGASAQKTAGIGTAITLTGDTSGEQMSVTVTKVISAASPSDSFNAPPAGDRLYAVQFRLTDTGVAAYSDAPSNGATVVDSAGQSYQSGLETVAGCQGFGGTENIAPGSSGLGCIVFEVPTSAKIAQVQFTLDSGLGPQTGQWDVS